MRRFTKIYRPKDICCTTALKNVGSAKGTSWDRAVGGSKGYLIDANELIIYEDNHLLVMFKPPTVLSQGDKGGDDSLLDAAKRYLVESKNKQGDAFLGMVHRLDRPCSGVIAFAKTSKAAMRLSEALRERDTDMKKDYICVVNGIVERGGKCEHWLAVDNKMNRTKTEVFNNINDPGVQPGQKLLQARLEYFPLLHIRKDSIYGNSMTLIRIELETGRKHQIRAQMSHIGHPVVGDSKYGSTQKMRDLALHSHMLEFPHPTQVTNSLASII